MTWEILEVDVRSAASAPVSAEPPERMGPPLAIQAAKLFDGWEMLMTPVEIWQSWQHSASLLTLITEHQADQDFSTRLLQIESDGTLCLVAPDMSRLRHTDRGQDLLLLGRDARFHTGTLGQLLQVTSEYLMVKPGPVYRAQRRRHCRFKFPQGWPAALRRPSEPQSGLSGVLVDISPGGAAFRPHSSLATWEPGQVWILELVWPAERESVAPETPRRPLEIMAETRHLRLVDGSLQVGLMFHPWPEMLQQISLWMDLHPELIPLP